MHLASAWHASLMVELQTVNVDLPTDVALWHWTGLASMELLRYG
jgi:hypothetical protein